MRIATALTILVLAALPAGASAQQSPFQALPPPSSTTETPTVVVPASNNTDTGSDSGLKTWQEFLIFGAGLILLLGIGWAIASDARRRAPVKDSELAHPGMGGATRRNRSQKQKERERAKAMAGRKQRRKGRR